MKGCSPEAKKLMSRVLWSVTLWFILAKRNEIIYNMWLVSKWTFMDTQTGADLLQMVVGITRLIKDPKEICSHETNMMKEKN